MLEVFTNSNNEGHLVEVVNPAAHDEKGEKGGMQVRAHAEVNLNKR